MVCCMILPVGHVTLYASIPFANGYFVRKFLTLFAAIFFEMVFFYLWEMGNNQINSKKHKFHAFVSLDCEEITESLTKLNQGFSRWKLIKKP